MQDKILSMIGMCRRAGRMAAGSRAAEDAVKSRKARLVIFAEDTKGGTKEALLRQCDQYHVPHIEYGTKDTLGRITGYGECACCAVTDEGLADSIRELYGSRKEERKPHGEDEDQ